MTLEYNNLEELKNDWEKIGEVVHEILGSDDLFTIAFEIKEPSQQVLIIDTREFSFDIGKMYGLWISKELKK